MIFYLGREIHKYYIYIYIYVYIIYMYIFSSVVVVNTYEIVLTEKEKTRKP